MFVRVLYLYFGACGISCVFIVFRKGFIYV